MLRRLFDFLGVVLIIGACWYVHAALGAFATGAAILVLNAYLDREV